MQQAGSKRQRRTYLREVQRVVRRERTTIPRFAATPITLTEEDRNTLLYPHGDAFVISTNINDTEVQQILIDRGSSADLLFASAFNAMGLSRASQTQAGTPLRGLGGRAIESLGQIELPVTFGFEEFARTEDIMFDVVDIPYQYTTIFGRRSSTPSTPSLITVSYA
jgi:hypothetical protein